MKYRQLILANFCITLGTVLNIVVPPLFLGIKPDFLLIFFFLGFSFVSSWKDALVLTFVGACFSAITSTIPGGILANFLDKMIVGPLFFSFLHLSKEKAQMSGFAVFIGTLLSGFLFLTTMSFLKLIPTSISQLFLIAVLPTAFLNTAIAGIIQKYSTKIFPQKNSLSH